MQLSIAENESELQYVWRMCSAKDSGTLDMTWEELANVLNKNLHEDETEYLGSSAYRKRFQYSKTFYEEVFSKMESNEYTNELMEQKRELERMKIQFRDERNAWNKQNYADARLTQKLDYLEEQLQDFGTRNYEYKPTTVLHSDNDLFVMLSDMHIGQTFDSAWGVYNTDVAKYRMDQYLDKIIDIQKLHKSENVYVSIQGDLVSGSIHKSLQVTNRENVIEQIKIAAQLITGFCYSLSGYFKNVVITNVSGNHSRIDKKDDALHDERLDDLIGWIVSNSLSHIPNVNFKTDNIDTGLAVMDIRGKKYVNCHGDYDGFNKSGVSKLCMMLQMFPYAITYGHLHSPALEECNGIMMVRGGSLAGSGDSYTIEKRLNGKPSQSVCVCTSEGIEAFYPIMLD